MELKRYLRLILTRWKLVALVTIACFLGATLMTADDSRVYQSSGTYVVRPKVLESDETVRATETLNRGTEINSTYARIARSEVVRTRALDALAAQGILTSGMKVTSRVIPGTNIIEIEVTGEEPEAVAAYASAVGAETAAYLSQTGELYEVEPLDTPPVPKRAEPSRRSMTLLLSLGFGLTAGVGLAFGVEYLREPLRNGAMNLVDSQTGAYRPEYFRLRLREEMARCGLHDSSPKRVSRRVAKEQGHRRPLQSVSASSGPIANGEVPNRFSLGLITIASTAGGGSVSQPSPVDGSDLRQVAHSLRPSLREQDVLAYIGDNTFAIIYPGLPYDSAEPALREWSEALESGTPPHRLSATLRVCECSEKTVVGNEEGMRIACAV